MLFGGRLQDFFGRLSITAHRLGRKSCISQLLYALFEYRVASLPQSWVGDQWHHVGHAYMNRRASVMTGGFSRPKLAQHKRQCFGRGLRPIGRQGNPLHRRCLALDDEHRTGGMVDERRRYAPEKKPIERIKTLTSHYQQAVPLRFRDTNRCLASLSALSGRDFMRRISS